LGCRNVEFFGSNPFGSVDVVWQDGPGKVKVAGWALDSDTTGPSQVHVYVGRHFKGSFTATAVRTDVSRAHPGHGPAPGYDTYISIRTPGRHNVCVFAINAGPGTANTLLG
jgi:hypothetical protein